jgi:Flagellar hook-length control protein FliK
MADQLNTSAGSLHPGRPVIWPSGKSSPTSSSPQASAGAQSSSAAAHTPAKVAPTPQEIAQAQAAAKVLERGQVARQYTQADLKELLLAQNIADTEANEKLATAMLRYGVEVSKSNFGKLASMIGSDASQTTQEAAILLLMKGIDSPAAAKTLSSFLADNPQLAAQLTSLKGNVQDLLTALAMGQNIMDGQLSGKLAAVLSQFGAEMDSVSGRYKFSGKGTMGRAELSSDLRALKALLDGVPGKQNLPDSAEGQIIESNINATSNRLGQMIQSVVSQAMLSKQSSKSEMNYSYYQIPNSLVKPSTTVDLIIKRSDKEGGKKIDPQDTQIIMSLETLNLGRVAVKMVIKGKNVDFLFNAQNDEVKSLIAGHSKELASSVSSKDYSVPKIQVNVNPSMCAIKPFLIPFLGIEDLMKIDVNA